MVLYSYNGTYHTLGNHIYGMFCYLYVSVYYTNPNVCLMHLLF